MTCAIIKILKQAPLLLDFTGAASFFTIMLNRPVAFTNNAQFLKSVRWFAEDPALWPF